MKRKKMDRLLGVALLALVAIGPLVSGCTQINGQGPPPILATLEAIGPPATAGLLAAEAKAFGCAKPDQADIMRRVLVGLKPSLDAGIEALDAVKSDPSLCPAKPAPAEPGALLDLYEPSGTQMSEITHCQVLGILRWTARYEFEQERMAAQQRMVAEWERSLTGAKPMPADVDGPDVIPRG